MTKASKARALAHSAATRALRKLDAGKPPTYLTPSEFMAAYKAGDARTGGFAIYGRGNNKHVLPVVNVNDVKSIDDSLNAARKSALEAVAAEYADNTKPSNPKDALGISKVPMSTVSAPVVAEVGVAMLEGALKYGRHNYRVIGVRASVYYDAVMARHMPAWWEGQDTDPDSGLSHVTKAIASLVVLRDAMIQGNLIDDRPPPSPEGWIEKLNDKVKEVLAKYPDPVAPYFADGKRGSGRTL